jgi:hypothetical protein
MATLAFTAILVIVLGLYYLLKIGRRETGLPPGKAVLLANPSAVR